jgi:hypothetical protein
MEFSPATGPSALALSFLRGRSMRHGACTLVDRKRAPTFVLRGCAAFCNESVKLIILMDPISTTRPGAFICRFGEKQVLNPPSHIHAHSQARVHSASRCHTLSSCALGHCMLLVRSHAPGGAVCKCTGQDSHARSRYLTGVGPCARAGEAKRTSVPPCSHARHRAHRAPPTIHVFVHAPTLD